MATDDSRKMGERLDDLKPHKHIRRSGRARHGFGLEASPVHKYSAHVGLSEDGDVNLIGDSCAEA